MTAFQPDIHESLQLLKMERFKKNCNNQALHWVIK